MRLPRLQRIKVLWGLLSLLFLAALFSEAPAQQLPIKSYTSADGLARDYVGCIVPDSHGFIWFCTPESLS
jgi:hypothetical protein